jgi:hypothetical protein
VIDWYGGVSWIRGNIIVIDWYGGVPATGAESAFVPDGFHQAMYGMSFPTWLSRPYSNIAEQDLNSPIIVES